MNGLTSVIYRFGCRKSSGELLDGVETLADHACARIGPRDAPFRCEKAGTEREPVGLAQVVFVKHLVISALFARPGECDRAVLVSPNPDYAQIIVENVERCRGWETDVVCRIWNQG